MKLTHVRVKDFRSLAGEHDFDIATGVNYFVGPNNCGKSNLIRALELALDPNATYVPESDRPASSAGGGRTPTTRITLSFQVGTTGPESTLLERARAYELGVRRARREASPSGKPQTYADVGEVRLVSSFVGAGTRQTSFQAKGLGAASLPTESREHRRLEEQFRSVVRFAVIHSGEDLQSLLSGRFHEILQLVIADHLRSELQEARSARAEYLAALQAKLLEPLRARVLERVGTLFPEIDVAELVPSVPTVEETLSSVDVRLGDSLTTQLSSKGTGVRGAVLVAMLQYLAEQSRRSLVLAVEEPEAFLHPAAQEATRTQLDQLARRSDVSLLVTTHSPYVISRSAEAMVTTLQKDHLGITSRVDSVTGDAGRADLLGPLFRDAGLARVVERSLEIPDGTELVVVTEGYTDGRFVELVCQATGHEDLVKGVHFLPAGGAVKVVPQAVLVRAATTLPVIALLDSDDSGRDAARKLKAFQWTSRRSILQLHEWPQVHCTHHDVEIEDLLPMSAVNALVERLGEERAVDRKFRCGRFWHRSFSPEWKELALVELAGLVTSDPGGVVWLVEELRKRAQLQSPAGQA